VAPGVVRIGEATMPVAGLDAPVGATVRLGW